MPVKPLTRPAHTWKTRDREWNLTERALILGVINVTPDSFSDGGDFLDPGKAIAHGEKLVQDGADLLDIGGESTRPGSIPVDVEEEIRRTLPVVKALAARGFTVSIDTVKAAVAKAALKAGACVVNDITGGRGDSDLPRVAAEFGAGYIAMHMPGDPHGSTPPPEYQDPVAEICADLTERIEVLEAAGLPSASIAIDPGIGYGSFGKTLEQILALMARLDKIVAIGHPVVIGCSRKTFIGDLSGAPVEDRLPGSLAAHLWAWQRGAQILRVHDVAATRQALAVWSGITGGAVTEQ